MLSSCSTAFVPELNGKTWCPFSRQSVTMTSTMAGSSSIIMILAIKSQRGEYFKIEKKKAEMRIQSNTSLPTLCVQNSRKLLPLPYFPIQHRPIPRPIEGNDILKYICRSCARNADEIGTKSRTNFPEHILLPQCT